MTCGTAITHISTDLWDSIASDLRGTVPLDAMAPGEQTLVPTQGQVSVRNAIAVVACGPLYWFPFLDRLKVSFGS